MGEFSLDKNCVYWYLAACTRPKWPNQVWWSVYCSSLIWVIESEKWQKNCDKRKPSLIIFIFSTVIYCHKSLFNNYETPHKNVNFETFWMTLGWTKKLLVETGWSYKRTSYQAEKISMMPTAPTTMSWILFWSNIHIHIWKSTWGNGHTRLLCPGVPVYFNLF